ncbi:MAG: TonB family protein [Acidobacteria bacterium]|nr:TonB family protein [Acidobacteriota bacterium]
MAASYTSFGNFLLLKQRSQDGFGTLWRAGEMERLGFKRIVWLRRFDQVGLDRTALAAEVPVTNQLSQMFRASNVVRNAACGVEGGVPYVAWDYVPSQPLDQLLERVGQEQFPVAIDNALLIAEKMAAALSAALAVEVRGEPLVHGFLVPQLVLIGNDGEALVGGFGLARGLLANLDRVAVQEMAAAYLAPEVLASHTPSRRSDVYSLGAILYQLLCGTPLPLESAARAAALQAPHLAQEEGPVPADVLAIVQKALAPRPEDRYGSAADFKRELEKLLYGGAYSPTTFNLALFMDRLYRHEIEEEDREVQREKSLDVTPYFRAPRSESAAAAAVEVAPAPPPSRTGLYIAIAGVAVLVAVIAYLLFGRPAPQAVDQATIAKLVQEQLAEYSKKEKDLADQLAAEKARTEEMQRQMEASKQAAATGKKPLTAEEQARIEQQKRELDARLAEQRRKEEELARVRAERAKAEAAASVKAASLPQAAPPPVATVAQQAVPPKPTSGPLAIEPTTAPLIQPTSAPAEIVPATAPPAETTSPSAVRPGDMVDFTQLDVTPQSLVEVKPTIPRAAVAAKVSAQGVVILRVLVNDKGSVDDVQVMRGFPVGKLGIDEACQDAARQYRFKPGMKDGVKVKTWATVTMRVDLSRTR